MFDEWPTSSTPWCSGRASAMPAAAEAPPTMPTEADRRARLPADALAMFNDQRAAGALISNLAPAGGSPGSQRAHIYAGNITSAVTGFDTNVANSAAIASPIISFIQDGTLLDINVLGCVQYRTILKDYYEKLTE